MSPLSVLLASGEPEPTETPGVRGDSITEQAEARCAEEGASICRVVADLTGNQTTGEWAQLLLGAPAKILLILLVGVLLRLLLHKIIERVVQRLVDGGSARGRDHQRGRGTGPWRSWSPPARCLRSAASSGPRRWVRCCAASPPA